MRISTWWRVLLSTLVLVLATMSVSACGDSGAGDLETATGLMEQWTAAWNNSDREALGAIFTEDATWVVTGVHNATSEGREEIVRNARVGPVHNNEVGEVTITEGGDFTCRATYEGGGYKFVAELTFKLDGDRISHLLVHDEFATDEASG